MYGAFAVFLFVLHASAFRWDTKKFTYIGNLGPAGISYRRSVSNGCSVCFAGQECLPFSPVECEYYIETNKILDEGNEVEDENLDPEMRATIDSLVFSIIETGKSEADMAECLPYVSKYTDCTKENICLGCKTCECDVRGRWNCSIETTCRPELIRIVADQKTLATVMETINKDPELTRRKRSSYHSLRSLEDVDVEAEMDDNYNDQQRFSPYETTPIDVEPEDTNTLFEDRPNIDEAKTAKHDYKNKDLVKLIIHSLIHDTLPDIFKANNLDFESNRVKRWITENKTKTNLINIDTTTHSILTLTDPDDEDMNTPKSKITFEELSEWVKEIHPLIYSENSNKTLLVKDTSYDGTTPETAPNLPPEDKITISNPEYIAFEEVYTNIQVDNKTNFRRKPLLDDADSKYTDKDYNMYENNYNEDTSSTSTLDYFSGNNIFDKSVVPTTSATSSLANDVTDNYLQPPTEVVVDLLETANMVDFDHETEKAELNNNQIDNTDKLDQISAVNIMKRDVSFSSTKDQYKSDLIISNNITTTNNTKTNTTTTSSINYLKKGVLDPLDTILENKQKEIREILRMRENLVKFIQVHKEHLKFNISSKDLPFKLYKLEYIPHYHQEPHSNVTVHDKYRLKLKHDVYEVIRDVLALRKLYNDTTKLPSDLNFLIRSLKHYIHKTGFRPRGNISFNSRRRNNVNSISQNSVKSAIIRIFDFLIKNIRYADALEPASKHSKRLIRRIIKQNYVDDFAGTGLRVYDPHYNLTNDLRNVGSRWHILTSSIETSPAADQLHNMKRLHLIMSADIAKMNDALALIEFARGRRMIPVDEADGEIVVVNINKNLDKIKYKIEGVMQKNITKPTSTDDLKLDENVAIKHKKKDSFMSQIKRLLTNSKKDILKLLRRKVPKSDIVKQIARKNVEEMTKKKLQDTMERWQTNLNIISRDKRSNKDYDKLNRRIKNIIPKYLRGKVHPAMAKGNKNKMGKGNKKNTTIEYKKKISTLKTKSHKDGNPKVTTSHPGAAKTTLKHSKPKHTSTGRMTAKPSTQASIANKITNRKTLMVKTKS